MLPRRSVSSFHALSAHKSCAALISMHLSAGCDSDNHLALVIFQTHTCVSSLLRRETGAMPLIEHVLDPNLSSVLCAGKL